MPYDINMSSNIVALKFLKMIDMVYQEDNLLLITSPKIMHSLKASGQSGPHISLHFIYWKVSLKVTKKKKKGFSAPTLKKQKSQVEDSVTLRQFFSREDLALTFYDNLRLSNTMPKVLLSVSSETWKGRVVKQAFVSTGTEGQGGSVSSFQDLFGQDH